MPDLYQVNFAIPTLSIQLWKLRDLHERYSFVFFAQHFMT